MNLKNSYNFFCFLFFVKNNFPFPIGYFSSIWNDSFFLSCIFDDLSMNQQQLLDGWLAGWLVGWFRSILQFDFFLFLDFFFYIRFSLYCYNVCLYEKNFQKKVTSGYWFVSYGTHTHTPFWYICLICFGLLFMSMFFFRLANENLNAKFTNASFFLKSLNYISPILPSFSLYSNRVGKKQWNNIKIK